MHRLPKLARILAATLVCLSSSLSSSTPPPPSNPTAPEVLAAVQLSITNSRGDSRAVVLELKAGDDVAKSAVLFAEQHGLGTAAHVADLARKLQEAAETSGTADRAKALVNASTWLKTAGAYKKRAKSAAADDHHDDAAADFVRALLRPGLDPQAAEQISLSLDVAMRDLAEFREQEAKEAAERAKFEARVAAEDAAAAETAQIKAEAEADWQRFEAFQRSQLGVLVDEVVKENVDESVIVSPEEASRRALARLPFVSLTLTRRSEPEQAKASSEAAKGSAEAKEKKKKTGKKKKKEKKESPVGNPENDEADQPETVPVVARVRPGEDAAFSAARFSRAHRLVGDARAMVDVASHLDRHIDVSRPARDWDLSQNDALSLIENTLLPQGNFSAAAAGYLRLLLKMKDADAESATSSRAASAGGGSGVDDATRAMYERGALEAVSWAVRADDATRQYLGVVGDDVAAKASDATADTENNNASSVLVGTGAQQRDWEAALAALDQLLNAKGGGGRSGQWAALALMRARCFVRLGRPTDVLRVAGEALTTWVNKGGGDQDFRALHGDSNAKGKSGPAAETGLEEGNDFEDGSGGDVGRWLRGTPRMMMVQAGAGAAGELGDMAKLKKFYQLVLRADPDQPQVSAQYKALKKLLKVLKSAQDLEKKGYNHKALKVLDEALGGMRALQLTSGAFRSGVLLQLCTLNSAIKRHEEALTYCDQAVDLRSPPMVPEAAVGGDGAAAPASSPPLASGMGGTFHDPAKYREALRARAEAEGHDNDHGEAVRDWSRALASAEASGAGREEVQGLRQKLAAANQAKQLWAQRRDHLATLELPQNLNQLSSEKQCSWVKRQHRKLARKWHPDKYRGNKDRAARKMGEVTEAKEALVKRFRC